MKRHLPLAWLILGSALLLTPFTAFLKSDPSHLKGSSPAHDPGVSTLLREGSQTFTVTSNADEGPGSLRSAIAAANDTTGTHVIDFMSGIGTINVGETTGVGLPAITNDVTITAGNSRVELNGAAAGTNGFGLRLLVPGIIVRGLAINRFARAGISVEADSCVIQNNFIGTNAAGTAALPNGGSGVVISGSDNLIGGLTSSARNVISGNMITGITIAQVVCPQCVGPTGTTQPTNNTIQGNFIGTDVTGSNPIGNSADGIVIIASNNTIGGTITGAGNVIAHNTGSGMSVTGLGNAILGNAIFQNGNLGINLGFDGVTPNDPCDTDTGQQNFPVLTSAFASGAGSTFITGTLESNLSTEYRIEFFSSPSCDASGNGEGQTFIGATDVVIPGNNCIAALNATLPVNLPPGSVVTATATNSSNNDTSEFSQCVIVTGFSPCTPFCPRDIVRFTSESSSACGTVVTFAAQVGGDCEDPTCVPSSGSVFPVGTTTVTCSADGGPSCSFSVTVIDETPPRISCPPGTTAALPAGQQSVVVNYPQPTATDNCGSTRITCVPPSGSAFPRGSTLVTCTARDESENAGRCFFFVTVFDGQPPVITCPANVSVVPPAGQTSAVVNYSAPTVSDNFPGTTVACSPASGSSFPLGSTTVVCTATDADGNRSSCSFTVGVGGPQARVTIPGNRTSLEFSANPTRKPPKPAKNPCTFFTIDNIGFAPLVLTFDSLRRTGSDVTSGRISDPNDVNPVPETTPTKFFTVFRLGANQSLTQITPGEVLAPVQPGQSQQFCVKFAALIPGLAGKTSGLAATDVLPDLLTSTLTFRQNGGANIGVPIQARVSTGLVLVNLTNRRAAPEVQFTRNGNDITVTFAVFDSNLDVNRARYEFLDNSGQVVAGPFDIDLTSTISSANLVRGQTFSVDQRFSGAESNPNVTGVRLTVFDGETSAGAPLAATASLSSGIQPMNRERRVTLYPPVMALR